MADEVSNMSHTGQARKLRAGSKILTHSLVPFEGLNLVLGKSKKSFSNCLDESTGTKDKVSLLCFF